MAPEEITVGEYLIQRLYEHGIRHIFGIPGDYVLGFCKQLEQSKIKFINTCDEQGAGFAADAYARVRGIGAVCITYSVGGLKVANTTAQAFAEESPVVIISGAPGMQERQGDPMLHHKVRTFETQYKVFEQLTVAATVLDNPETACREINRVLGAAICYRRPVYIELPRDMVLKKILPARVPILPPDMDSKPLQEAMRDTEEMINKARRPVIIAGVELMRYRMGGQLIKFAEQTNIPIASSILSKSVVDEQHPLYIGVYWGGMSQEKVRQYVETSDCVIFLGMFMTDINLGVFTAHLDQGASIFSTSEKTSIRYHTYNSVYLSSFVHALLKADIKRKDVSKIPHTMEKREFKAHTDILITVDRVLQLLEAVLSSDNPVIADTGDALFASADFTLPKAAEYMSAAYYASMGFAVPASIGVQLALPGVRPLVIVGDGAFQMTGMELSTAVRYRLNPIVVVLNNYGYGTERPMLDGTFNDIYSWQYSRLPQFLNAGKGFDIHTEEDFEKAMKEALAYTEGFCILEVHLDPNGISPALQRLAGALGKRVR
jgi:TPP-dependent 2-oxoacid decarboxylase